MAESEVPDIIGLLKTRISTVLASEFPAGKIDENKPVNLGPLPRIVLEYMDTPWEYSTSGRLQIVHTIQIVMVEAPYVDAIRARKAALGHVRDVKRALFLDVNGGLQLQDSPQVYLKGSGSQWLRSVRYPPNEGDDFFAAGIIVRAVEMTAELL